MREPHNIGECFDGIYRLAELPLEELVSHSGGGVMGDNVMSHDCSTPWQVGGLRYFHSSLAFPGISVGCRSEYRPDLSIQDHASGVVRDMAGKTGKALRLAPRFCVDGGVGNGTGGGLGQVFTSGNWSFTFF